MLALLCRYHRNASIHRLDAPHRGLLFGPALLSCPCRFWEGMADISTDNGRWAPLNSVITGHILKAAVLRGLCQRPPDQDKEPAVGLANGPAVEGDVAVCGRR